VLDKEECSNLRENWEAKILPRRSRGQGESGGEVCAIEVSRSFGNLSLEFASSGSKI
jgi:hypothetical protein